METPAQRSGTISPPVFYTSALIIAALVLFAGFSRKLHKVFLAICKHGSLITSAGSTFWRLP